MSHEGRNERASCSPHRSNRKAPVERGIVLLEFPSVADWETFYYGPVYQGLKAVRDGCSSARLVSVVGIDDYPPAPVANQQTQSVEGCR